MQLCIYMILQLSLMFLQHDINRQLSYSVDLREKKEITEILITDSIVYLPGMDKT